jgi:hypothetical protein
MSIAFWIPKTKNTQSKYVNIIVFPQQQWLHERVSMLYISTLPALLFVSIGRADGPSSRTGRSYRTNTRGLNAQGKDDIRYFLCCFVRKELLSF